MFVVLAIEIRPWGADPMAELVGRTMVDVVAAVVTAAAADALLDCGAEVGAGACREGGTTGHDGLPGGSWLCAPYSTHWIRWAGNS